MLGRHFSKLLLALFASGLLVGSVWYLVSFFEWREAFASLRQTNFIKLVGLVLAAHIAFLYVRTWRWLIVVRVSNPTARFIDLYWITAVLLGLSIVTPGQLGEALKIELLKRRGLLDRLHGLGSFAIERILDLVVVAGMGIVGLVFGSGLSESYPAFENGAITLFVLGMLALSILWCIDPERFSSPWLKKVCVGSGSPVIWVKMGLLTVLSWGLVAVAWKISLDSVGVFLSLAEILLLISFVTVGTIMSFIPGGLGVAEVMTIQALMNMGVAQIAAQAGAIILRVYALMVVLIGTLHLLSWFFWSVSRPRAT